MSRMGGRSIEEQEHGLQQEIGQEQVRAVQFEIGGGGEHQRQDADTEAQPCQGKCQPDVVPAEQFGLGPWGSQQNSAQPSHSDHLMRDGGRGPIMEQYITADRKKKQRISQAIQPDARAAAPCVECGAQRTGRGVGSKHPVGAQTRPANSRLASAAVPVV